MASMKVYKSNVITFFGGRGEGGGGYTQICIVMELTAQNFNYTCIKCNNIKYLPHVSPTKYISLDLHM